MCWNFEVSTISFIIGMIISKLYYMRNNPFDRSFSYLIFTYSFVQLCEAIIWLSLTNKTLFNIDSKIINKFATNMLYFVLFSHLIGYGYGIYKENLNYGIVNYTPIYIGVFFFLYVICQRKNFNAESNTTDKSNCHLVWNFYDNKDYMKYYIMLCVVFVLMTIKYTNIKNSYIGLIFLSLTYIISFITNTDGLSSYWCWISAFLSFIPLIISNNK